jgi:Na+/melibiose symporter-like transporter
LIEQPQSPTFILSLRLLFAVVPLVFLGLGLYFARKFPLTPSLYERLREVLEAKRAKGAADARIEEQAAELRDILVGHKKL